MMVVVVSITWVLVEIGVVGVEGLMIGEVGVSGSVRDGRLVGCLINLN